jgi:hypothetical protein
MPHAPLTPGAPKPTAAPGPARTPAKKLPTVKGQALIKLFDFIREKHGAAGLQLLLSKLSPQDYALCTQGLTALTKVPAPLFPTLHHLIRDLFGNGDSDYYAVAFEYVGEKSLNSFMKLFLKLGTPAFVAHNAPLIWRHFFDTGRLVKIAGTAHSVELLAVGHEDYGDSLCWAIIGFGRMAIRMSGGKNLRVNHDECLFKGKTRCYFKVEWD